MNYSYKFYFALFLTALLSNCADEKKSLTPDKSFKSDTVVSQTDFSDDFNVKADLYISNKNCSIDKCIVNDVKKEACCYTEPPKGVSLCCLGPTPQAEAHACSPSGKICYKFCDFCIPYGWKYYLSKDRKTDPGQISCGIKKCDLNNSYCCFWTNGVKFCESSKTMQCGGRIWKCDEKADCSTNEICATAVLSQDPNDKKFDVGCFNKNNLKIEQYQVCKESKECANGKKCVEQDCKNVTISTCGLIPKGICKK